MNVETVNVDGKEVAIIVRLNTVDDGANFVTSPDDIIQFGTFKWPMGKEIQPHRHNNISRSFSGTNEVLFILKGKMVVKFYDDENCPKSDCELGAGDAVVLKGGAHGFSMIEDCEFLS